MTKRSVVFLHPDLGIGGAERLVVDAALANQRRARYEVQFVTNHHDKHHCFAETKDGQFKVTVVGSWLPRSVLGSARALCAYVRMCYAALYICLFIPSSIIFVDQIAACIPILRLFSPRRKILFYCHFPDQLLSQRGSTVKQFYRYPLDWLEEWSTGLAHCVLVNSQFTASIFRETFKSLSEVPLKVVYPTFNAASLDRSTGDKVLDRQLLEEELGHELLRHCDCLFVSLNRFERKKNVALAIRAFGSLSQDQLLSPNTLQKCHLVVAGGYDKNNAENKEHFVELRELVEQLGLTGSVTLLASPSDAVKSALIRHSRALLYTPSFEHFGIVPLEAMYLRTPVVAVANGGPLETVRHNETGFLCEGARAEAEFARAMAKLALNPALAASMGEAGRDWVVQTFHFDAFAEQLCRICAELHTPDM